MIHFSHGDNTIVVNLDPAYVTAVAYHSTTVISPLTSPLTVLSREYVDIIEFRSTRPEPPDIDFIRPTLVYDHALVYDAHTGNLDMITLGPNDTVTWRPE